MIIKNRYTNKVIFDGEKYELSGANLTEADLTEADLTGVNLTGAYLRGADLTEANLTGAYLFNCTGNGVEITTIVSDYIVNINDDNVWIGCMRKKWADWLEIGEEEILKIDEKNCGIEKWEILKRMISDAILIRDMKTGE